MNKKSACIAIILAGLMGMLTFACEGKQPDLAGEQSTQETETAAGAVAETTDVAMRGLIEESGSGAMVLVTGQDQFVLDYDSDLSLLVGRQVKVTGTLVTDGSTNSIRVTGIEDDSGSLVE
jgi:hypothetical protein